MASISAHSAIVTKQPKWLGFWAPARSLSGRLLLVTILCVLAVESLIFIPSSARFRMEWLRERMNAAQIATLTVQAAPGMRVTDELAAQLLGHAGVTAVYVNHNGMRELILGSPDIPGPASIVDFRQMAGPRYWLDTVGCLISPKGRYMRVVDTPMGEGDLLEMVIAQEPLQKDLRAYASRMLAFSLILSIITGSLVYLVLFLGVVRPILRLSAHIEKFRDAPHDAGALIQSSGRKDEIGRAEEALADMEAQVRSSLQSKDRLAALGGAVARIAHDLRNSLAAAQIVSERLADSDDPKVRQSAPRLERALQRAINLAENTLSYGRAEEAAPKLQTLLLRPIIAEAAAEALASHANVQLDIAAPDGLSVQADPDNLHRIIGNLVRNAAQAIASQKDLSGAISISARRDGADAFIEVADNGPGVPERVKPNLFAPFSASTRQGGSGLGLAIARELARAMGGDLSLLEGNGTGARFALRLPAA